MDDIKEEGFFHACCFNNIKIIQYFIEDLLINTSNEYYALINACKYNSEDVVKYLSGIFNIFEVDFVGQDVLMRACKHNNNLQTIKFLVEELKFNVHKISMFNRNSLSDAIKFNVNPLIIKYMISLRKDDEFDVIIKRNMLEERESSKKA